MKNPSSFTLILFSLLLLSPLHAQQLEPAPSVPKQVVDRMAFLAHNGDNFAHLMDVEISGDRAYVLVGVSGGLETYDISNPMNPVRIDMDGPAAWGAKAYGDRLYTFNRNNGFRIYDIAGPLPSFLGNYNPSISNHLYENGVLVGNTLYVAAHQQSLFTFDVTNPGSPQLLNQINLEESASWDVEYKDGHLIVANGRFGLSVVDLSGTPTEVAALPLPGLANHIVLDRDVAVVSLGGDGIATVDITNPASPVLLDRAPTEGNAFGSGIHNQTVVVGSWSVLELFDVSDPTKIRRIGFDHTKTWAMGADIAAYGNKGLVAIADWRGMSTYMAEPDQGPDIDVLPDRVDFGKVTGTENKAVVVRNTGTSDLNVTVTGIPSGINVNPTAFTVESGEAQSVRIQATGTASLKGKFYFNSNDPDEPSLTEYVYKNSNFTQIGSVAPEFKLKDINGYWHYLSDYVGKVIYLEFGGLW